MFLEVAEDKVLEDLVCLDAALNRLSDATHKHEMIAPCAGGRPQRERTART